MTDLRGTHLLMHTDTVCKPEILSAQMQQEHRLRRDPPIDACGLKVYVIYISIQLLRACKHLTYKIAVMQLEFPRLNSLCTRSFLELSELVLTPSSLCMRLSTKMSLRIQSGLETSPLTQNQILLLKRYSSFSRFMYSCSFRTNVNEPLFAGDVVILDMHLILINIFSTVRIAWTYNRSYNPFVMVGYFNYQQTWLNN